MASRLFSMLAKLLDVALSSPSDGDVLTFNSTAQKWENHQSAAGGVTSVAATVPASLLTLSGSPITTSGTLEFSLANQSANTFLRGPTSGGSATPTFGGLVSADIPTISGDNISGGTPSVASIVVAPGSDISGDFSLLTFGSDPSFQFDGSPLTISWEGNDGCLLLKTQSGTWYGLEASFMTSNSLFCGDLENVSFITSPFGSGDLTVDAQSGNLYLQSFASLGLTVNGHAHSFKTDGSLVMSNDVLAQKLLLYSASNNKYGIGIQSSEIRFFSPQLMTFGAMSTSDGTTYSEFVRFDCANKRFSVGTFGVAAGTIFDPNNSATGSVGTAEIFHVGRTVTGGVSYPQVFAVKVGRYIAPTGSSPNTRVDFGLKSTSSSTFEGDVTALTLRADARVVIGAPNTAIESAGLANGQISFYLDESGNNLKVSAKYSNGTTKTGTVALS